MSIQSEVASYVATLGPGKVFSYSDLPVYKASPNAAIKALGRLVKANTIKRLSKGNFYRPKQGLLGEIKPSDSELLKSVLFKGSKQVAYVTGASLYNRLGLTTQIPKTVTIAVNGARQVKDLETIRIRYKVAKAPISQENIVPLELLDVIKDIKAISDKHPESVLNWLQLKLAALTFSQLTQLSGLAILYYPASVRAMLGLLCELIGDEKNVIKLRDSLNPLTRYNIGVNNTLAKEWYIK